MLEMDDGFAGGACRCRHCGTIQTVPSRLKNKTATAKASRTLYQSKPDPGVPSSGLDRLADVVASSGLSSARLRKSDIPATPQKQQPNVKMLLIASGIVIAFLGGALVILLTRDHGSAAPADATPVVHATPAAPIVKHVDPNFCGMPIKGETVVYVLDRGDSTRDSFGDLKSATLRSIASLGADRKFQIVFWNNGADESFPKNWPVYATVDNLSAAERAIDDVAAHGKTQITSALRKAMEGDPSEIVIATGKAWDLDDAFVKTIDEVRSDKPVRINTISLGDPGVSTALQTVAARGRGSFKTVSENELKEAAH
jgi:hypothetical protein